MAYSQKHYSDLLRLAIKEVDGVAFMRMASLQNDARLDLIDDIKADYKFGTNDDIDTGSTPEDVWFGGGTYTGFPTGTPEELEIILSNADDIGGVLNLRTVPDSDATSWTKTDVTTTGASTDTGVTAYRCTRGIWDGTNSATPGVNAGTITVRHKTTTANVFMVIPAGKGQSRVCCEYVLPGFTMLITKLLVHVSKKTSAIVEGEFWVREPGKTPALRRPFTASDSLDHEDLIPQGFLVPSGSDIAVRIDSTSSNNARVLADFDFLLYKN